MFIKWLFLSGLLVLEQLAWAQQYKSIESHIRFFSDAPMEDIEAVNTKASSAFDLSSGSIAFSVPMNQFQFQKSLMQEHFNENYLETEKFPKATFLGKMSVAELDDGKNTVTITGEMSMHGVKKAMTVTGLMTKIGTRIQAHAEFTLLLKDYNIKIPKAVFYNIAEEIAITVDFMYEPNN
jgi:polyisoprenoid-binding protein YceI